MAVFKRNRVPVISFNIKDIDSSIVADRLWMEYSIAVRSGIHCAPLIHQALGTDKQGTVSFLVFSRFNTQEEVKQALIAIKRNQGRFMSRLGKSLKISDNI